MNNKPVAYRHLHEDGWEYYDAPTSEDCKDCIPLYTHLAKTEEFVAGDAICPSCGCKSLYKTARSEWCVTHKCLWQKDYELTLTDEEIMECKAHVEVMYGCLAPLEFAWLILKKASEK